MNIKDIFKENKVRFSIICISIIIEILCATGVTYLMTPAFNYIKQNNLQAFLVFVILSASFQFLDTVLRAVNVVLYNQQIQDCFHKIRNNISKHFIDTNEKNIAEIQNDLNSNMEQLNSKYATPLLVLIRRALTIVFSIGILITFHWSLVVLTLILSIIGLYVPKAFENLTSAATFTVTQKNKNLFDTIEKWARGLDELRRYGSFNRYEDAIKKSTLSLKNATIEDCFWGNMATAVTSFISLIGIVLLLVLSMYLYATGKIVFGAVITSGILANQIMSAITYIAESLNEIKSSRKIRQKINKLQQPLNIQKIRKLSDNIIDQIKISKLQVSFNNGRNIKYPDILINKGDKVLLTGNSGTGKTTLFKVLLNQITPKEGKVIYKDTTGKIFEPNPEEIGYIAQDNILFPDTIENNITMFKTSLDKKVNKIIEKVKLVADVDKFPDGVKTIVDLDKENLSGGQKQKVILARAEIHDSQLLLIDEGTSAIDSGATKRIIKELLKSDQTIIMIAHNFSKDLISLFDKRINLNEGAN